MPAVLDYDLLQQRAGMIAEIKRRNFRDERILWAMQQVPREEFVPNNHRADAYSDTPLPIGLGQTISQPYIVALMIGLANLHPGSRVLEIGTGSGYAAAVMAQLAKQVFSIERQASLHEQAKKRLHQLGYHNISLRQGDGALGWGEESPFDSIVISAACDRIPPRLLHQLASGGHLVIPLGDQKGQRLLRVVRSSADRYESKDFGAVSFVPFVTTVEPESGLGNRDFWRTTPSG